MNEPLIIAICFCIFIALIYKYAGNNIIKIINGKINDIVAHINEAKLIRDEADIILKNAKNELNKAKIYAETILIDAKKSVNITGEENQKKLQQSIEQQNQQIERALEKAKQSIITDISNKALKISSDIVCEIIKNSDISDISIAKNIGLSKERINYTSKK